MPQHDGKPTRGEIRARAPSAPANHVRELEARPVCAVCGKLVERMTEEEDTWSDVVTFTAYCHGERDRILIPGSGLKGISFGVAFGSSPRRLEGK